MFPGVFGSGSYGGGSGSQDPIEIAIQLMIDEQAKAGVIKGINDVAKAAKAAGEATAASVGTVPLPAKGSEQQKAEIAASEAAVARLGTISQEVNVGISQTAQQAAEAQRNASKETARWEGEERQLGRAGIYASNAISQIGSMATIAGAAITAGLVVTANEYIKSGVDVNAFTEKWKRNSNDVADAQIRIGRVTSEAVLPAYQALAGIQEKLAGFLEAHPEAAQAAGVIGLVLTTLGSFMTVAAAGVRIYSDISFSIATGAMVKAMRDADVASTKMVASGIANNAAGDKMVAAAGIEKLAADEQTAAAGGLLAGVGKFLTGVVVPILAGLALLTAGGSNVLPQYKAGGTGGTTTDPTDPALKARAAANNLSLQQEIDYEKQQAQLQADYDAEELAAAKKHDEDLLNAHDAWAQRDAEIAQTHADNLAKINQDNAEAIARINQQYATQLANAYANFALSQKNAAENYALQREEIIRNEGEQIKNIEADLQKKLKQMAQDHDDKMYSLASARDAFGMVQEQRAYDRARKQAIDDANDEIAKLKRDTALRLEEDARRFQLQQRQAREQFNLQMAQAAVAYQQQLAAQAQQYADQMLAEDLHAAEEKKKNDAAWKVTKDRIDKEYNDEEQVRFDNHIKQLMKLQEQMGIQNKLRDDWYAYEYASLTAWLAANKLAVDRYWESLPKNYSGGMVHDFTGYAYRGIYAMAQNGMSQYVLSGQATRAAENMLGGKLSERSMMAALVAGSGGTSISWYDHRRFDGDVSAGVRRIVREETLSTLREVLH